MIMTTDERTSDRKPALSLEQEQLMNAWWRAANFLSLGQNYLLDNPLLREPLKMEHVKPRLLGHWQQVPESGDRRRRAADPASQRL
jgi:xylulose-5-phosphate/fructose-6-phosphate phosphoketolase